MLKVALTGNIASGKTSVENILIDMGFKVICADKITSKLYEQKEVQEKILNIFKTLDKNEIAKIVFSDISKKQELENLLHPLIMDEINNFFDLNKDEKIVFASLALLYEANLHKNFDKVILVASDKKIRLERLMKRNSYTKSYALKRISSQLDECVKKEFADFVVDNNGSLNELKPQIEAILNELKNH